MSNAPATAASTADFEFRKYSDSERQRAYDVGVEDAFFGHPGAPRDSMFGEDGKSYRTGYRDGRRLLRIVLRVPPGQRVPQPVSV